MIRDFTCKHCTKVFRKGISPANIAKGAGQYCSRACSFAVVRLRQSYACEVCGKPFTALPAERAAGNAKYCSRECQHATMKTGEHRACPQCGKQFYTADTRKVFCNQSCYAASMRGSFAQTCQQCHAQFTTAKSVKRQFCSWTCLHAWRRDRLAPFHDAIRHMYVVDQMTIYEIGKVFNVAGTTIQEQLKHMQIPRRTHNERTALAQRNRVGNSIEQAMEALLRELKLSYRRQEPLGHYAFDFYLPDHHTLIECDGTFWHADPRFFPDPSKFYPVQTKTTQNDKRKTTYAAKKGFRLVRFWEHDIVNNREWVKTCLIAALS